MTHQNTQWKPKHGFPHNRITAPRVVRIATVKRGKARFYHPERDPMGKENTKTIRSN